MYRLSPTGFVDSQQRKCKFLRLSTTSASANWEAKQASSKDEYLDATGKPTDEPTVAAYRLFGHYAVSVVSGRQGLRILDVGCGVGRDPPPYATELLKAAQTVPNTYFGL